MFWLFVQNRYPMQGWSFSALRVPFDILHLSVPTAIPKLRGTVVLELWGFVAEVAGRSKASVKALWLGDEYHLWSDSGLLERSSRF